MRIPKYRLHKPSGRAVFQFAPLFGSKRIYLPGAYGSEESRTEYEKLRARAVEYLLGSQAVPPQRSRQPTVGELCWAFLDWSETHHGGKEYDHYRAVVRRLVARNESTKLSDFGPLTLKEVRKDMVAAGWSRNHVNHQINRVRYIFRWGIENEWCDASVLANLQAVSPLRKGKSDARETSPVEPISWDEASQLLPYVAPVIRAMIEVQFLTGMRSDELTCMKGRYIDRSGSEWIYEPTEHKTAWRGKRKIVVIGPRAKAILAAYLTDDPEAYIFSPAVAVAEQKAARAAARKTKTYGKARERQARTRRVNDRYDYHSFQGAINHGFRQWVKAISKEKKVPAKPKGKSLADWLAEYGIKFWHPHQLRHTRGTLTRDAFGIEGAQAQLGNTFEATQIYAEKSLALAKRIALETG